MQCRGGKKESCLFAMHMNRLSITSTRNIKTSEYTNGGGFANLSIYRASEDQSGIVIFVSVSFAVIT